MLEFRAMRNGFGKWFWFFVLVGGGLSCTKPAAPGADRAASLLSSFEPFPQSGGVLEREHWYSLWLQEKPAGSHRVHIHRYQTPRGLRRLIYSCTRLRLRIGRAVSELVFEQKDLLDDQHHLLRSWQAESEDDADKIQTHAGRVGEEMITIRGPEIKRVPFEPTALRLESFQSLFALAPALPGAVRSYRSYEADVAGYVDNQLTVKRVGRLVHSKSSQPGVLTQIEVDPDFFPRRMQSSLGSLRILLKREAGKPDPDQIEAPDLGPLTRVSSNARFAQPRKLERARFRVAGLPAYVQAAWLTGPGQRVLSQPAPGTFLIEITRLPPPQPVSFPLSLNKTEWAEFLAPTALVQSHDAEIGKLARELTRGAPHAWAAAKRLRVFVSRTIDATRSMTFASAREVLRQKSGDCSEQSVLLAALARAVGLPARCVMGLVFADGSFQRHMWNEIWVGRWQPIDAAMQTDTLSAAWIRLGVHAVRLSEDLDTGLGGLLAFAAPLKVTVEPIADEPPDKKNR